MNCISNIPFYLNVSKGGSAGASSSSSANANAQGGGFGGGMTFIFAH